MIGALLTAVESALWWLLSALWAVLSWCFSPVPVAVTAITGVLLYRYITRNYDFWPSRGVRCVPTKVPWGQATGEKNLIAIDQLFYDKYHGKEGYIGYMELMEPTLHVSNPDLMRSIFIKDFEYFTDRREFAISEDFLLMLQVMNGQKWRDTRSVLTPTFSSSKMKAMHQLCLDNAHNLSNYMLHQTKTCGKVEPKDAYGRFTMDNIASCAFGVQCNSFTDPNNEFAGHAMHFAEPFSGYTLARVLALLVFPKWFVYRFLPDPYRTSVDFFKRVVAKTIEHREGSDAVRRDYLQLLLETKDKNGQRVLSQDSIVMNSVLFFIAGYDTTASLLTFCSFALATAPECQDRLLREIDDVLDRHGGQLTYESIGEMTYLDQVVSETLRLYPIAVRLERKCSKDYTLPDTDVHIPRGLIVQFPILAIHRDAKYYPDPLKFDPDRFLPAAKAERHPCVYMPFGAGPRNCVAMRFALFEAKVALVAALRNSRLEPSEDTPPPPLPIDRTAFLLRPEKPLYLKLVPRT